MSIAQSKRRFLALIAVLVFITALTISLTLSGGFVHLGTALWHFINLIVTYGPATMSHSF